MKFSEMPYTRPDIDAMRKLADEIAAVDPHQVTKQPPPKHPPQMGQAHHLLHRAAVDGGNQGHPRKPRLLDGAGIFAAADLVAHNESGGKRAQGDGDPFPSGIAHEEIRMAPVP